MSVPTEVFISHSHLDHEVLLRLSAELTRHGVPHWYAERDIRGSQQWHDEIGAALERCDWFAVLLSPGAVQSTWVKREVVYAVREIERFDGRVVPIVWEPCKARSLSWTLDSIQSVALQPDFAAGVRDLLRMWGIGYRG